MLVRKLVRELRRQSGQTAAVLTVIALGVMLFLASAAAYVDLRDSYSATRERLALADLHVEVEAVHPDDVARVARLSGVALADSRSIVVAPVRIAARRVQLRLLSLPDDRDPILDRVLVTAGVLPQGDDEILIEKHLARHHHLGPDDTVDLVAGGTSRRLRVSGVGVSAEYLWVARDAQDVMPSPDSFGVGWMRRAALRGIHPTSDQLLIELAPGADPSEITRAIGLALGPERIGRVVSEDELVGVRLLQLDVDGSRGMAAFFPIFFLGIGAFIVASILARLVDAQRPLIGTLMALGVGRGRILGHYLTYGIALGGAGALIGVLAGVGLAPVMTRGYASELGIPFVSARAHGDLAAWGTLLGVGVGALAALLPAIHASREVPAAAMRPPRPTTGRLARLVRRLPAPLLVRVAVRDILGRPFRSLTTALGVAAAVVVVVTTGGLLDSMRVTFTSTFDRAHREALRVDLVGPEPADEVVARLGAIDGVVASEGLLAGVVSLESSHGTAEAVLQGLDDEARLVRSVDADGTLVPPPPGGIVLTRALARALHVRRGDEVRVTRRGSATSTTFRVAGLADAAMGPTASAPRDEVGAALGLEGMVTSVALAVDPAQASAAREAVAALPDAARVVDAAQVRAQMATLMGLGWAMLGAMLLFASVLAAAILYNTASLGVLERRRDLATLRALGRTLRELGVELTIEHAVLAIAGIAIGLPIAFLATKHLTSAFSSELFTLPFVVAPVTLIVAVGGILAILLVAQWPALRSVGRMELADAVRTRES
jgi:putative ABC transport system permease protein